MPGPLIPAAFTGLSPVSCHLVSVIFAVYAQCLLLSYAGYTIALYLYPLLPYASIPFPYTCTLFFFMPSYLQLMSVPFASFYPDPYHLMPVSFAVFVQFSLLTLFLVLCHLMHVTFAFCCCMMPVSCACCYFIPHHNEVFFVCFFFSFLFLCLRIPIMLLHNSMLM